MATPTTPLSVHFGLQDPRFQSLVYPMIVPTVINTAGNVTYTPQQLQGGMILRDTNGGARTDTLPSASSLAAQIQGVMVGTSFQFELRNTSGAANAITLAAGTGVTLNPAATSVAQLNTRTYTVVFTNVTPGQVAYTLYAGAAGPF
jgi:hypothetical protein